MPPSRVVSESELRRRFNDGNYWLRTTSGELQAVIRRNGHPSPERSGEPYWTRSQIIAYYDVTGARIAIVHQYLRPDGTIGGSGRPDPKQLIEDGTEYRAPTLGTDRTIRVNVQLDEPAERHVDVDIETDFDPDIGDRWAGSLHRQVYDGVHEGIGAAGVALPGSGLLVRITDLTIDPPVNDETDEADADRVGVTVRALVGATVNVLLHGRRQPLSSHA